MLGRIVPNKCSNRNIFGHAKACVPHQIERMNGGTVRGTDDRGNVVCLHDVRQMRPYVWITFCIHYDLHGIQRQVHFKQQPLKTAEGRQIFGGRQVLINVCNVSMTKLGQIPCKPICGAGIIHADIIKRFARKHPVNNKNFGNERSNAI